MNWYSPNPQQIQSTQPRFGHTHPGWHKLQVIPHSLSCCVPIGHFLHTAEPFDGANLPGTQHGHSSNFEPCLLFAVPGLHGLHDVLHLSGWIVPGLHLSHVLFLATLLAAVPLSQHVRLHEQGLSV